MNRAATYELECFVAVAEELNFSRAARRLNISQPPLSRQIQSLERKLGTRLLVRNTRTVALTPAGTLYLQDARQILTQLDAAAAAAGRAAGGEVARLRLAFVGALLDESLVQVLQRFRQRHPQCQIHLADLSPAEQLKALQAGQLDGAFIGAPPWKPGRNIATRIWKREPLLAALGERHKLAAARSVSLVALKRENWVMVSRAGAPAFRRQFDRLCAEVNMRPRVIQESERVAAVLTMVAAEQGISLLPASISRLVHPGVVFRKVKGAGFQFDHAFAFPTDGAKPAVKELLALLPPVQD
jgi:DNA-binding transcriptional LysR family regulator